MWTLLLKDTDCCSISFFVNLIPNISAAIFWKQRLIWNWYNFIQLLAKPLQVIPKCWQCYFSLIIFLLISPKLTHRIQKKFYFETRHQESKIIIKSKTKQVKMTNVFQTIGWVQVRQGQWLNNLPFSSEIRSQITVSLT